MFSCSSPVLVRLVESSAMSDNNDTGWLFHHVGVSGCDTIGSFKYAGAMSKAQKALQFERSY